MAALVVDTPNTAVESIKVARSWVKEHNRNAKVKQRLNIAEFKDANLESYPSKLKETLVEAISYKTQGKQRFLRTDTRIHAVYIDMEDCELNPSDRYTLLSQNLPRCCLCNTQRKAQVVFDQYNDRPFQQELYDLLYTEWGRANLALSHESSEKLWALQAVDIVTRVVRRQLNEQDLDNYEKISPLIVECKEVFSS